MITNLFIFLNAIDSNVTYHKLEDLVVREEGIAGGLRCISKCGGDVIVCSLRTVCVF